MKHNSLIALFAAITLFFTGQLSALDEDRGAGGAGIVRMWKAGVSADTILLFIRQEGAVFSADDVAVIAEAGLPDRFIRDLVKAANSSRDSGDARSSPVYYPPPRYYPYGYPWYPRGFYGGSYPGFHPGGYYGGHYYGHRYRPNIQPHGSTGHHGGRAHSGVWGSGGHSAAGHSGGGHHGSSHAGGGHHGH
ncbi:MAG: hypothetical protein NDJ92_16490 [Thermoanaerobaculia bacterium]|nr:hypothetical protein [Thermoanaerobaculia bacterium]